MFSITERASAIIIDDEPEIIELIQTYLEELKLFKIIVSASDGVIGLSKINKQKFDLIILDVNLPKKSGTDIIKQLKEVDPNSTKKVLLISGELDKKVLERAMAGGVKNFLVKPFDEEKFNTKIKAMLGVKD